MVENPYFKEHLGDLEEEEAARDIVKHLRFLHRLEAIVELKNDAEISPGSLPDGWSGCFTGQSVSLHSTSSSQDSVKALSVMVFAANSRQGTKDPTNSTPTGTSRA